jgi:glyoxylase-like metal-dependent hydrolase (beta-lactamase superfamily II)
MDQSMATYAEGMGQALVIPHTMFLLKGPVTVIVDTSFESPAAVRSAYPQRIWREPGEEPLELLKQLAVTPDQVSLVVCTHLHYDHCGTNRRFVRARIVAQRVELAYALDPVAHLMRREYFAPTGGFTPPYDPGQLELLDGDTDLGDGLTVLHLPGHTPGSQGLMVDTARGRLALAGDQIMVRENYDQGIPVGLHTDLDAWYLSLEKLRHETSWVAPSHDLRLFSHGSPIQELT